MTPRPRSPERGLTLVEVLLGIAIGGLVLLALAGSMSSLLREERGAIAASRRLRLAEGLLDRLGRGIRGAIPGETFRGDAGGIDLVTASFDDGRPVRLVATREEDGLRYGESALPFADPVATRIPEIRSFHLRYRGSDGGWREAWSDSSPPGAVSLDFGVEGETYGTIVWIPVRTK